MLSFVPEQVSSHASVVRTDRTDRTDCAIGQEETQSVSVFVGRLQGFLQRELELLDHLQDSSTFLLDNTCR